MTTQTLAVPPSSTPSTTPPPAAPPRWATAIWSGASGASGDPLVLLHGGTGSWMHWMRNIEDLSRDFMLLVPDMPGSGESAMPALPTSVEKVAAALLAGIDAILGPERRFAIAGVLDGRADLRLCREARRRAASTAWCWSARPARRRRAPRCEPLKSWRRLPTDDGEARSAPQESRHPDDPRSGQDRRRRGLHAAPQCRALAHPRQARRADRRPRETPARLAGPARRHLGRARRHRRCPISTSGARSCEQFQPGATFDVIPGAGHWVQYEAPDEFNRLWRARGCAARSGIVSIFGQAPVT